MNRCASDMIQPTGFEEGDKGTHQPTETQNYQEPQGIQQAQETLGTRQNSEISNQPFVNPLDLIADDKQDQEAFGISDNLISQEGPETNTRHLNSVQVQLPPPTGRRNTRQFPRDNRVAA
jgi:hypothetical protein